MRITPKQLAIGAIVTIAVGFPLTALLMLLSTGSALQIAVAAAALVAFYVPFHREVKAALDGAEPGGLTVSTVILIIAAYAPMTVLGFFWVTFPSMLGSVLLLRLRMPWGLVALAPVVGGQVWFATLAYSSNPSSSSNSSSSPVSVFYGGSTSGSRSWSRASCCTRRCGWWRSPGSWSGPGPSWRRPRCCASGCASPGTCTTGSAAA
nr:hypothetical protein GCM10020093_110940 [Planobispora longispora]